MKSIFKFSVLALSLGLLSSCSKEPTSSNPGGPSDTVAPAAIANLAAGFRTGGTVALSWTATGDDGTSGIAVEYDVRYSIAPITQAKWDSAAQAAAEPAPKLSGGAESFVVENLLANTAYNFAIRAKDEAGNFSPISNVPTATTDSSPGFFDSPAIAGGVEVVGSRAYLADGDSGLSIVDISNPSAPVRIGKFRNDSLPPPPLQSGFAYGVTVRSDTAFLADGSSFRLRVVNVSNPAAPTLIRSYRIFDQPLDVAINGNYAYVVAGDSGLRIIDISSAVDMITGIFDTPDFANGIALAGTYAYVADGTTGLMVVNVSNPAAPVLAGGFNTPVYAEGIALSGNFAYVADGSSGLIILDISNPAAPVQVGDLDTPGWATNVTVSGNFAFVSARSAGLQIIDVSNPASPKLVGIFNTPDEALDAVVVGNYAFVADRFSGLRLMRFTP